MAARTFREDVLQQIASAQAGLITAAQLRELGVPTSTVSKRSRPGGMWSRVLPGIHLIEGGRPDRLQREMAALLYAGPQSMLTGLTALRHHDSQLARRRWMPDDSFVVERVHVLIPHARRRIASSFVDLERTHYLPEPEFRDGLAVAPAARAVCDAARRMRGEGDVAALVIDSVRRGTASTDDLVRELGHAQRRGSRHLRIAVGHATAGVWSGWEGRLRDVLAVARIPLLQWNPRLYSPSGHLIGIPDAWIDDVAVAIEVDSREHHSEGDDWARTLDRQARYAAEGVLCVPLTPSQIRDRPDYVVALVEGAYAAGLARPRPAVRALHSVGRGQGSRTQVSWAG